MIYNKIRSKRTILSYTTIFFTKESTVHQKKKSRIFSHSTNLEPSCPPPQISGEDLEETHQVPATGQTSKHFPGVKLRKRKSSIINHPSLSIFARKITLEQIVLPPKKKQIVFVLGVFSMKIFNKTTFTKKTCRQNQKSTCKKLLASKKKHTKTAQTQKSGVFTAWKKRLCSPLQTPQNGGFLPHSSPETSKGPWPRSKWPQQTIHQMCILRVRKESWWTGCFRK